MEAAKSIEPTNESSINESSPKIINNSEQSFNESYYLKQIIELKDEIIRLQNIIIKDKETIRDLENRLKEQNCPKENYITPNEDTPETPNLITPNEDFNILEKEVVFKMNDCNNSYSSICILKDGRLAASSSFIIIYNKKTFKSEITIKEHSGYVHYITQLKNNNFVSVGDDCYINIYNIFEDKYLVLQKVKAHTGNIYKLRELDNDRFMTCSSDSYIKFFFKENNEYKEDYSFQDGDSSNNYIFNILRTKEGEIAYFQEVYEKSIWNYYIKFYDIKSRKKIESAKVNCVYNNVDNLFMISKIFLLVGVKNSILIFDINQHRQIKEIKCDNSDFISSFFKLDERTLLSGDSKGQLRQWIINEDNLILENTKEKAHNGRINMIINNSESLIITCSNDKTINVWK